MRLGPRGRRWVQLIALGFAMSSSSATAAPDGPPCTPSPGDGVEVRADAYVIDYHFTATGQASWNDPNSWSWGTWAEEAAPAATVPAARMLSCITAQGDTSEPFVSYPRVIIGAGTNALIDGTISAIGELVIAPSAWKLHSDSPSGETASTSPPDVGA